MTRAQLRFLAFALVVWVVCFVVLHRFGTWTPFAFAGVSLSVGAVWSGIVPRSLLKLSVARAAIGVAGGALMVVGTHVAYRVVVAAAPPVAGATARLMVLLDVAGFSPAARTLLIVLIASTEEVIFRGLLPSSTTGAGRRPHLPARRELAVIAAFAAVYALTTLPLGSPLLVLCALVCGTLWGVMRVATGSLVVPILAHVLWDLGVLLLWPLPAQLP